MQPVVPYLTVRDAAAAIVFYQKAFGATEESRMPAEDKKRLMHAVLNLNGGTVFLADAFQEHGGAAAPTENDRVPVAVALQLAKTADVDATYEKAVAAGATGTMPPADMFWGGRFAALQDPFGHRWLLNAQLAK